MSTAGRTQLMLVEPTADMLQVTTVGTTLTPHVDTFHWQMTVNTHMHAA